MLKDNSKRLLCSITQEKDFYAQGQLQETSFAQSLLKETSMLKNNSKRLPLLNHNWKRLILTITKNWIRFWILDIQSEVFTKQYEQNRLCFSRHLRILRYDNCKNSLSCWCVYDVLHREYWPFVLVYVCVFFKSLSLFIEDLRDVENLAVTSTLSCLKLWFFTIDLLPDLIIVLWRTNFKSIPFETEQRLQQSYCYSCLVVETCCRAGGCRGVRRVSGRTVHTLYFVNSGEVASDEMLLITFLLMTLLLMTCLQERFLQTRFFRRILSDALSFNKIHLLFNLFN